jgi:hypothetical protein
MSFYFFEDDELKLTEEQLLYIKELRCGKIMHSWRALARKFTRKYPEFMKAHKLEEMADREDQLKHFANVMTPEEKAEMTAWESGNQLLGIDLCTAAMKHFKETMEDGEW